MSWYQLISLSFNIKFSSFSLLLMRCHLIQEKKEMLPVLLDNLTDKTSLCGSTRPHPQPDLWFLTSIRNLLILVLKRTDQFTLYPCLTFTAVTGSISSDQIENPNIISGWIDDWKQNWGCNIIQWKSAHVIALPFIKSQLGTPGNEISADHFALLKWPWHQCDGAGRWSAAREAADVVSLLISVKIAHSLQSSTSVRLTSLSKHELSGNLAFCPLPAHWKRDDSMVFPEQSKKLRVEVNPGERQSNVDAEVAQARPQDLSSNQKLPSLSLIRG